MSKPRASKAEPKAKPEPRAEPKERRSPSIAEFISERVGTYITIAARNGVIYEGMLAGKEHGFLILKNATVRGSKWVAKVSTVLVNIDAIQHIHGPPLELKPADQTP